MNYNEALEYIHKINWCFCNPGLDRIKELCNKLGNPEKKLKFVHVAGTNGKGSFCAMLASVLEKAGYKTGLFTSPYVKVFNERMAIDGNMISNEELAVLTEKIKPIADSMQDKPTEFELITALAFEYFAKHNCDYVILECGLGGRLDSTNIIENPILSVITGIALDHTSILGDTIDKISYEKAGIIKKGIPCLWCGKNKIATDIISKKALEMNAEFHMVEHQLVKARSLSLECSVLDWKNYKNIELSLLGEYQLFNVANVLTAIEILNKNGLEINETSIREGLSSVVWHARFEIINKTPLIIADGGHNPEGVESAVKSVKTYFGDEKLYVITGVMSDKDYDFIAEQISSISDEVFCITPNNPRALKAEEYANIYRKKGVVANAYSTVQEALSFAIEKAKQNGKSIICMGSLYMYCEVCEAKEKLLKVQ